MFNAAADVKTTARRPASRFFVPPPEKWSAARRLGLVSE
jgi:hypothetical protein